MIPYGNYKTAFCLAVSVGVHENKYRPRERSKLFPMDVFLMSSCIATSRLVHNGGYIQKLLQRTIHLKYCELEDCIL